MFTELTANILYLNARVCVCLCIHWCMYSRCEEHVAFSGGIGAVSLMGFFFFLSSSPLREQTPRPILAQLCFSRTRRAVLWKSYMPRLTPGPQTLATPVVRCFGGVKSKKCLHASLPVYLRVSLS